MRLFLTTLFFVVASAVHSFAKPTLWIIGDSTVRNSTAGQQGWGDPLIAEFDPVKIEVVNRAIGGRSSRTFLTQGRWDAVLTNLKPGDFVMMQFGHNDGGDFFEGDRPRASIKGVGEETRVGTVESTGKEETVYSFGWYLRKFCTEAKAAGATPIVVSLIPRNRRDGDGHVITDELTYALWAKQVAEKTGAFFIDLNARLAKRYNELGEEVTDALFDRPDHTHTNSAGAAFNASVVAGSIRELDGCALADALRSSSAWLPHVFSDHMVLQREVAIPVWGRATPGATVEVSLVESTAKTVATGDGNWLIHLPQRGAGGPFTLSVATGGETLEFNDVLVGDVWFCSGQSNMDFTVAATEKRPWSGTSGWKEEVAAADSPNIRMFSADWTLREFPQPDVGGTWEPASSATVGDFSAVAYFFGRELHQQLEVPVGLVVCAYGASTAEAWVSGEKLESQPVFEPLLEAYKTKRLTFRDDVTSFREYGKARAVWEDLGATGRAPKNPDPVQDQHNPTVLFNGMVAPLVPYAIRGAIWYQGESNLGTRGMYSDLQNALIEDWRSRWGAGDFPFYFVQLAPYKKPLSKPAESSLATMRAAQAASLALPNTGMAITLGLGDVDDIHPRNKQGVGDRLARLALARAYGMDLVASGPTFRSAGIEGDRVWLSFDSVGGGLRVAGGGDLGQFAIAASDEKFVWATALIEDGMVVASSPEVLEPAYVRYAWADNPEGANLSNVEGLPAAPFSIELSRTSQD